MHQVRVLRRAQEDLTEIQRYLRVDAPALADDVMDQLLAALDRLARFPTLGPVCRDDGLRTRGYRAPSVGRYRIFYKVLTVHVRVYRVLHQRRGYDDIV